MAENIGQMWHGWQLHGVAGSSIKEQLFLFVTVFASVIVFVYVFEHKIMAENIGQMWRGWQLHGVGND